MPHYTPWNPPGYTFTAHWFMRRSEPIWQKHFVGMRFRRYCEIGVFEGQSLLWASRNLLLDNADAVVIDNWRPVRDTPKWTNEANEARLRAMDNIAQLRREKPDQTIRVLQQSSDRALAGMIAAADCQFDLIYCDGCHRADNTLTDLVLSWRLLAMGGVLIVDDTHLERARRRRHDPKTREAVEAFLSTHLGICSLYNTGDQVAFKKVRQRLPLHPPGSR